MPPIQRSQQVTKIYCADGNAGISEIAECLAIKPHEIVKLADFAEQNSVDLTFVGGEIALALGITDEFERRNLKIIGVSRQAAQLEASNRSPKILCSGTRFRPPNIRIASSTAEAQEILRSGIFGDENQPLVIKADGLAAGKGVVVAPNGNAAARAVDELEALVGAEAVSQIVLEGMFVRQGSFAAFIRRRA